MADRHPTCNPLLQTAAKARSVLTPAALDGVGRFLCELRNRDGGFPGPPSEEATGGAPSDVYFTLFGLMGLAAVGQPPSALQEALAFLRKQKCKSLDDTHRAALALSLSLLGDASPAGRALSYEKDVAQTAYGLFLAALLDRNAGRRRSKGDGVRRLQSLRCRNGGYSNSAEAAGPTAAATAAALMVRHWSGAGLDLEAVNWLLSTSLTHRGFRNAPQSPEADLLSTAVSLFALGSLGQARADVALRCLDFADACRRPSGGFAAHPDYGEPDCEYTFYALLAAGAARWSVLP